MKNYFRCVYLFLSSIYGALAFGDTQGYIVEGKDTDRYSAAIPDGFDIKDSVMTFEKFNVKERGMLAHNVSLYRDIIVFVTGGECSHIDGKLSVIGNEVDTLGIVNKNGITVGANGSFSGIKKELVFSGGGIGRVNLDAFDASKMERGRELKIVVQDFASVAPNKNGLPVKTGAIRKFWKGSYAPITIDYYFSGNSERPAEFAGLQGNVRQKGVYGFQKWGIGQNDGIDPAGKFTSPNYDRLMKKLAQENAPLAQAVIDSLSARVLRGVNLQKRVAVSGPNYWESYDSSGNFDSKSLKEVGETLLPSSHVGTPTESYSSFSTEYYPITSFKESTIDDHDVKGPYDFWGQDSPTGKTENRLISMEGRRVVMLSENAKIEQNWDLGRDSDRQDLYNFWQLNTGLFPKENLKEMASSKDVLNLSIKQNDKILNR